MTDSSPAPAAGAQAPVASREDTGPVVVGVDGSASSMRALDMAAEEAGHRGVTLEIVYSATWPRRSRVPVTDADLDRIRVAGATLVDEAAQRAVGMVPGLNVVTEVHTEALAADVLVKASRTASLTVVGTRGHGGFAGLLVGSVGLRVATHCAGPLLVVGESREHGPTGRGSVLVGAHTDRDEATLRYGFEVHGRQGLAAQGSPPRMPGKLQLPRHEAEKGRDQALQQAHRLVDPVAKRYSGVEVVVEEQSGSPAAALIEASRAADLTVIAVRRRQHRRLGLQLGTVAHAVLHHAHSPVVLLPVRDG